MSKIKTILLATALGVLTTASCDDDGGSGPSKVPQGTGSSYSTGSSSALDASAGSAQDAGVNTTDADAGADAGTAQEAGSVNLVARALSKNIHGSMQTLADGTASPTKFQARYVTSDPSVNQLLGLTQSQLDTNNAFFKRLGTNQRTCASCHLPSAAWGISTVQTQAIFNASNGGLDQDRLGLSAIFTPIDGANCPTTPVASLSQRREAYSALLNEGLIRIRIGVPPGAEFDVTSVADPYRCSATCGGTSGPACSAPGATLSEYRRPLPTTNLRALSTLMFDGRETIAGSLSLTSPACSSPPCAVPVCTRPPCTSSGSLQNQANNAVIGHMQGVGLTSAQEQEIVNFQFRNLSAQVRDNLVGDLTAGGAQGGPAALHAQTAFIGHNDNFGDCVDQACRTLLAPLGIGKRGAPFNPRVFTIYRAWEGSSDPNRASIARGEVLFNTFPIPITGVSGINDEPVFCAAVPSDPGCQGQSPTGPTVVNGGCVTCHDAPNFGDHSVVAALNIGLADPQPASATTPIGGTTPGAFLPLYTATCNTTGQAHHACTIGGPDCTAPPGGSAMAAPTCGSIKLTDLGRGLITGKWKQLGRFKGPILRGMPARAPFFHNGFATDPSKVLNFYEERFGIVLGDGQRADLINFLNAL
jgi:hypothetical protein